MRYDESGYPDELITKLTKAAAAEAVLNAQKHRHCGTVVVWGFGAWKDSWPEFEPRPITLFGVLPIVEA